MKPGLVRKTLIDRLGRETTRWVRPGREAPLAIVPVPRLPLEDPAHAGFEPRSKLLAQLIEQENNWTYVPLVDPQLLAVLDEAALAAEEVPGEAGASLQYVLSSITDQAFKHLRAHGDPSRVHNLAVFHGQIVPDGRWFRADDLLNGIDGLTEGPPHTPACFEPFRGVTDFSDLDEHALEQARALVLASETLDDSLVTALHPQQRDRFTECRFVRGEGLAALIMERPGDVERIIEIANEHVTENADLIREMLDHSVQVLRDGVL